MKRIPLFAASCLLSWAALGCAKHHRADPWSSGRSPQEEARLKQLSTMAAEDAEGVDQSVDGREAERSRTYLRHEKQHVVDQPRVRR